MAFISVKGGTVISVNSKGFTLVESYTKQTGDVVNNYFKVWSSEPVLEGSVVNVSGVHSARISEYEGKQRLEVHINNARIEKSAVAPVKPADDLPF
jgi:hypothetical protein